MKMQLCGGIFISVALIMGLSSVEGQDIGKCVDGLTQAITNDINAICPAMSDYMKCVMKELNLVNLGLTNDNIQMLESQMNTQLAQSGVSCDIDIQRLFNELKEEANQGGSEGSTARPPTFEEATTMGECISALTRAAISAGGITCADADPYVKCMVRVMNLHQMTTTDSEIKQFEEQVEGELKKQGLDCELNVQQMINDLKGTVIPSLELNSPEFEKCTKDNAADATSPTCDEIKSILRCVMSVDSAYMRVSSSQLNTLQTILNQQFSRCNVNVVSVQEELKRGGNSAVAIRGSLLSSVLVTLGMFLLTRLF